jgi:hypothetical protein
MNSYENSSFTNNNEIPDVFEISIWLDSYNDIFSDFDSRPFSERTVSDDFLSEVRKVCDEKSRDKIHLKLSVPEKMRNTDDEKIIIKRLHLYFKNSLTEKYTRLILYHRRYTINDLCQLYFILKNTKILYSYIINSL